MFHFYTPCKRQKNFSFFDVFMSYRIKHWLKWVKNHLFHHIEISQLICNEDLLILDISGLKDFQRLAVNRLPKLFLTTFIDFKFQS